MFRLRTTALIAGSLLGIFVVHVNARGRSFPIEVTGTIKMFDRANHTFTFQSDKPARVLTIAVGRECQFFENGAPAGEWILKKNARVKVSYFSTIFTGNIAVRIESNPVPEVKTGIIERIKSADRSFRITHQRRPLVGRWATNDRKEMSPKSASKIGAIIRRQGGTAQVEAYSNVERPAGGPTWSVLVTVQFVFPQ